MHTPMKHDGSIESVLPQQPPHIGVPLEADRSPSKQLSDVKAETETIGGAAVGIGIPDIGPAPDGGLRAWSVICSSSLVLFCVFGFGT